MAESKDMGLDEQLGGSVSLKSGDGKVFEVDRKDAAISGMVKKVLEQDADASEVPLPSVQGSVLAQVVEFMKHHKGGDMDPPEKPLRSKKMKDVVKDQWDADFIDRIGENLRDLYDIVLAANYLDIRGLLHLGCAKIASLIKGQPLEKIKDILDPNKPRSQEEAKKD